MDPPFLLIGIEDDSFNVRSRAAAGAHGGDYQREAAGHRFVGDQRVAFLDAGEGEDVGGSEDGADVADVAYVLNVGARQVGGAGLGDLGLDLAGEDQAALDAGFCPGVEEEVRAFADGDAADEGHGDAATTVRWQPRGTAGEPDRVPAVAGVEDLVDVYAFGQQRARNLRAGTEDVIREREFLALGGDGGVGDAVGGGAAEAGLSVIQDSLCGGRVAGCTAGGHAL